MSTQTKKYNAWCWDDDKNDEVCFESSHECCSRCIEDKRFYQFNDDSACCCDHEEEYEERKDYKNKTGKDLTSYEYWNTNYWLNKEEK